MVKAAKEKLKGTISAIKFAKEDGPRAFRICVVEVDTASFPWPELEITVKGPLGDIKKHQMYEFTGKMVEHASYGKQFEALSCQIALPETADELAGSLYENGIAVTDAAQISKRIFKKFGKKAIKKLVADPTQIETIKISNAADLKLVTDYFNDRHDEAVFNDELLDWLAKLGFKDRLSDRILTRYGTETKKVIEDNPYQLVLDIEQIGFKRADDAAQVLGFKLDDPKRLRAAILVAINDETFNAGATYVNEQHLLSQAMEMLGDIGDIQLFKDQLAQLITDHELQAEDKNHIYPYFLYRAEWLIAEHLQRLVKADEAVNLDEIKQAVDQAEHEAKITYDEQQKQAIQMALEKKVILLTGGPGTGKTTIIRGIVNSFAQLHDVEDEEIILAAPTGRAAQQMTAATKMPASTIHHLLSLTGQETPSKMKASRLKGQLLIIDEMSMVDTLLFKTLVAAIPKSMHVVLVGDQDQLPSVGPGQVFRDLLSFANLPQVRLTQIHRQDEKSTIIPLSKQVNEGQVAKDFFAQALPDRSFIPTNNNYVSEHLCQLMDWGLKQPGCDLMNVQVLIPMHKGPAGIEQQNRNLQAHLNPPQAGRQEVKLGETIFRRGDKVIQTVNDAANNVYNGDMGIIEVIEGGDNAPVERTKAGKDIKKPLKVTVRFNNHEVTYNRKDLANLQLAYCVTIHKSQGSQFKMVILLMMPNYQKMFQRNLLYTGITRTTDFLLLLGQAQAFEACILQPPLARDTMLTKRLTTVWEQPETYLAPEPVSDDDIQTAVAQIPHADVIEFLTPTQLAPEKEVIEVKLPKPAAPAENDRLTVAMIENETVDPLIGMAGILPTDD